MSASCEDCGAELDDFGPCGCVVDARKAAPKPKPVTFGMGSMRVMVERKLARQRAEKKP